MHNISREKWFFFDMDSALVIESLDMLSNPENQLTSLYRLSSALQVYLKQFLSS